MVPLLTASSGFEARIVAAHLGAEGIVWQLQGGGADGIYPLGPVTILVPADELDDACAVAFAHHERDDDEPIGGHGTGRLAQWWAGVAVVALSCGFLLARLLNLD
jgi:hypothetical protein